MTFRIGRGITRLSEPKRLEHRRDHEDVYQDHVIRYNLNTNSYEIMTSGRTIVLSLNIDPRTIIETLVQLKIKISYLAMCEANPMHWYDYTAHQEPVGADMIELVPRYGPGKPHTVRAPFLPNQYYRLRDEIAKDVFQAIIRGTVNVNVYTYGSSTYYERRSQKGDIVVLEFNEKQDKYYIYPISAEIKELIEPVLVHPKSYQDVLNWLSRSYGSSDWLDKAMQTGDWYRVERVILSHNVFIPFESLNVLITEFKKRYGGGINISSRFAREYKELASAYKDKGA